MRLLDNSSLLSKEKMRQGFRISKTTTISSYIESRAFRKECIENLIRYKSQFTEIRFQASLEYIKVTEIKKRKFDHEDWETFLMAIVPTQIIAEFRNNNKTK